MERKGSELNILGVYEMATIHNMEVSKKGVNGKYEKVGTVAITVFSLQDFGIDIPATSEDKETGLLTYADAKVQFVYASLFAAAKADARNKLEPGSATIKAGNQLATTVDELIAKSEGGAAALALAREFLTSFGTYLKTKSGKSEVVQALYLQMAKVRQSITISSEAKRAGFAAQLAGYLEHASTDDATKYGDLITTLGDLASNVEEIGEDDL
jgi:hypothetical protein